MSKKIYGGLDVTHNVTVQGKRTIQGINEQVFDDNGNVVIDAYSREELLNVVSLLPLSHYGTHTYLPAGVSGFFNGAAENISYRKEKLLLEDDGTLVLLRTGTNGSVEGVYYSYLSNALVVEDMNLTVNTNKQYQPGYFGSDRYAVSLIGSDEKLVVGTYKTYSNTGTGIFISVTNGTLNDTQHNGILIPGTSLSTIVPQGILQFVLMANDGSLYFFSTDTDNNKFEVVVVNATIDIGAGTISATRLTNWTTKTFYNTTVSAQNNLIIQQKTESTLASDKPYVLRPNTLLGYGTYLTSVDLYVAQEPGTNNFRLRVNGDAWGATGSYDTRPQHSFSYTFNTSTRQCTLDAGNDIGSFSAPLVITDTGTQLISTGNVINSDDFYNHNGYRNIYSSYYYSNTGRAFCVSSPNLAESLTMQSAVYPIQSTYNLQNVRAVHGLDFKAGIVRPTFGSAVGSYINGVEILPNNSTKQYSRSSDTGFLRPSYSVHKATPDFTFSSLTRGTILGYEPTVERNFVGDVISNRALISSVSGNNVVTNGGIFMCNIRYTQPLSYDKNMLTTGTISITPSVLDSLRDSEFAKVISTWNLSGPNGREFILYVPQQTDIPAFAMLSAVNNNNQNYIKIIEVNVNTRTGNITSATWSRDVYEGLHGTNYRTNAAGGVGSSAFGLSIYDMGTTYFIGGSNPLTLPTIGNTNTQQFRSIVTKATKQFSSFIITGEHPSYDQGVQPAALPGIGFGLLYGIDQNNKMVFSKIGTTMADYNNWTTTGDPINVVSQDVAQGFIVYFTENTPVMLSGKSFTLPITNIDLTTIKPNPANSTFQVYVKMDQGLVKYHITPDVISETGTTAYNLFWIGSITTNALQITDINIQKRSRLDIYGASLEAAGSSFPVSYGLPSGNGTINW